MGKNSWFIKLRWLHGRNCVVKAPLFLTGPTKPNPESSDTNYTINTMYISHYLTPKSCFHLNFNLIVAEALNCLQFHYKASIPTLEHRNDPIARCIFLVEHCLRVVASAIPCHGISPTLLAHSDCRTAALSANPPIAYNFASTIRGMTS